MQRRAGIRAQHRLSVADALVAATALEERCEVIIGNDALMARRLTEIPYLYLDDYV